MSKNKSKSELLENIEVASSDAATNVLLDKDASGGVKTGTLIKTVYAEPCSIASFAASVAHNSRNEETADKRKGLRASLEQHGIKQTADATLMVVEITKDELDKEIDARRGFYEGLGPERQARFESYLDPDKIKYAPVNGLQRCATVRDMILDGKAPKGKFRCDVMTFDSVADMISASVAANELDTVGKIQFSMPERLTAAEKLFRETRSRQAFINCFRPGTGPKLLGMLVYDQQFPKDKLLDKVRRFWADQDAKREGAPRGIDFAKIDQKISQMASTTKPMVPAEGQKIVSQALKQTKDFRPNPILREKQLIDIGSASGQSALVRFVAWCILEGHAKALVEGLSSLDNRNLDAGLRTKPDGTSEAYFVQVSDVQTLPDDDE